VEGNANEIPPLGTLLHLSNEETNGLSSLRAGRRQGLGLWALRAFTRGSLVTFTGALVRAAMPREDPTVLTTEPIVSCLLTARESCFETSARWGVWLGRHICYTTTQVS
jgi:hypothetical protein